MSLKKILVRFLTLVNFKRALEKKRGKNLVIGKRRLSRKMEQNNGPEMGDWQQIWKTNTEKKNAIRRGKESRKNSLSDLWGRRREAHLVTMCSQLISGSVFDGQNHAVISHLHKSQYTCFMSEPGTPCNGNREEGLSGKQHEGALLHLEQGSWPLVYLLGSKCHGQVYYIIYSISYMWWHCGWSWYSRSPIDDLFWLV